MTRHQALPSPTDRPTARSRSASSQPARTPSSSQRHSAIPGGRAGRLRRRLSDRDLELLSLLRRMRFMTGEQLLRLSFPDGNPITQARKCRAALKRLFDHGLVVRLHRRIGGFGSGSDVQILGLSGLGLAVLDVGNPTKRRHRSVTDTKVAYKEHALAVSDLLVELTERSRAGRCELLQFDAEPESWRLFAGVGGQRLILKPDAFVRLAIDEWEIASFIEQDMDTESLPTIGRKCQIYVDYWRSGQEQHNRDVFPRVWWLVPDLGRLKAIARVITRLPGDARQLFAIALTEEASDQLVQLPSPGDTA
jgi:Replication-relaxation